MATLVFGQNSQRTRGFLQSELSPHLSFIRYTLFEGLPEWFDQEPKPGDCVLLMGALAVQHVFGKKAKVTKMEEACFELDGVRYFPIRHPNSVLRTEGTDAHKFSLQQFRLSIAFFIKSVNGVPEEQEFKYTVIKDPQQFYDILTTELPLYVDIETNGLNPFRDDAKLWCFAVQQGTGPVYWHRQRRDFDYGVFFSRFRIIAHRNTFEGMWLLSKWGVKLHFHFDTKVGAFLRDENDQTGLKYQAIRNLGVAPWVEEMDFQHPDFSVIAPYNARDTSYGNRLFEEIDRPYFRAHPRMARLLRYIIMPAQEVFVDTIVRGFHIDMEMAASRLVECRDKLNASLARIEVHAGHAVNPGSPKQMASFLYDELGLPCLVKTAKGKPSTNEPALIRIAHLHPVVDDTLDWRKWKKFDSTYLTPWMRKGPILHANYGFTDTDTGRLNSTMVKNSRHEKKAGATLHQCPRDPFIRQLVCTRNGPDWCLLAADVSQGELRLVAHSSRDKTMMQIFKDKRDIHTETAMEVLNVKEVKEEETRKKAKAVNFGFVYGMYPPKFLAYAKEKFGLTISLREAKRYREAFFEKFSGLQPWYRQVERYVSETGYIDSVYGRRRHLPGAMYDSGLVDWMRNAQIRYAINSPIQGALSDTLLFVVALIASNSLSWGFKVDPNKAFQIGSAHDSTLWECRVDYALQLKQGIQWTMDNLPVKKYFDFEFRVPMIMDVDIYKSHWKGEKLKLAA